VARKLSKEDAVDIAVRDAVTRAGVDRSAARADASDTTFPNSALGAARPGEWSADMQTSGWTIRVAAGGRSLEYRANPRQVRLVGPDGDNHVVFPD
jgi:hypothetical protein